MSTPREFTVAFYVGSLDRGRCKQRAQDAGLVLVMEDSAHLYYRVTARTVREADNLVYTAAERGTEGSTLC